MKLKFVQLAKPYDWNGTLAVSITDALSEAELDGVNALYFPDASNWRMPLIAVGTDDPINTHQNIRRVYSEQRRITLPSQLVISNLRLNPEELDSEWLKVFASNGIIGFKSYTNSGRELGDRHLESIKEEVQSEIKSNTLLD